MAQVSYPGVYIQEISSGVRTITSVSTSIAAFFGRASKGSIDEAKRILSLADYERTFGVPHPKSDLAHSVRQFFANGGTDCYVVRLAKNAKKAEVTLENLNGTQVLVPKAKAEGLWGNTVRLEVDYNTPNPDETFNLRVIHEEDGAVKARETHSGLSMDPSFAKFAPDFVTASSDLIELSLAAAMGDPKIPASFINILGNSFAGLSNGRRPLGADANAVQTALTTLFGKGQTSFDISVNGSGYKTVDLSSAPAVPNASVAVIVTNIEDKINTRLAELSPAQTVAVALNNVANLGRLLTITSNAGAQSHVGVRRASDKDIAGALMLGVDQGGVEPTRYSNFRPAPTASLLRVGTTGAPGDLTALNLVAGIQQNAITQITIDGEAVVLNTAKHNIQTSPGHRWFVNKANDSKVTGDNDGVREKLKIMAAAINNNSKLKFRAEVWGYHLALIALDGTINNQPATMAAGTADFDNGLTLNVREYSLGDAGTGNFSVAGPKGDDGVAPDLDSYKGSENEQKGFHALDKVDLFNLMVLPEDEEITAATLEDLWGPASTYCKKHRAFLLVDPPAAWTDKTGRPEVVQDVSLINDLRSTLEKDHSAVFYPRLKLKVSGVSRTIAPAGTIAGLMARTDASRGVWKAPAGIEAGLRAISGVKVALTDAENGVLNKKGVNCIRAFPNGIVNWGSRTLDGDDDSGSDWKYIPIRRLALMIEESLFRGTRWAVFEPNDERLWSNIRLNVNAYMMSLFRDGAFQGTDPKAAFYVKCDKDTTTQDDRNKGIVNIEVGFAPVKPAEFVLIKIQQIAGEL